MSNSPGLKNIGALALDTTKILLENDKLRSENQRLEKAVYILVEKLGKLTEILESKGLNIDESQQNKA